MVVVKSTRDTYGDKSNYLYNALNYLYDEEKALHMGGYAVNPYNLKETYEQMMIVKRYFNKTSGNPLMHFIVSFDENVKTYETAKSLAVLICSYFKCRYQVLWAVHFKCRDNSMYHLHIIVNSVSFLDGKMFNSSPEELSRFCMHIQNCSGSPCVYRFASVLSSDDN